MRRAYLFFVFLKILGLGFGSPQFGLETVVLSHLALPVRHSIFEFCFERISLPLMVGGVLLSIYFLLRHELDPLPEAVRFSVLLVELALQSQELERELVELLFGLS